MRAESDTHLLISTAPALAGHHCQGKRCLRAMTPGEPFHLVAHRRRITAEPNAQDARAYLCATCALRVLGA